MGPCLWSSKEWGGWRTVAGGAGAVEGSEAPENTVGRAGSRLGMVRRAASAIFQTSSVEFQVPHTSRSLLVNLSCEMGLWKPVLKAPVKSPCKLLHVIKAPF